MFVYVKWEAILLLYFSLVFFWFRLNAIRSATSIEFLFFFVYCTAVQLYLCYMYPWYRCITCVTLYCICCCAHTMCMSLYASSSFSLFFFFCQVNVSILRIVDSPLWYYTILVSYIVWLWIELFALYAHISTSVWVNIIAFYMPKMKNRKIKTT